VVHGMFLHKRPLSPAGIFRDDRIARPLYSRRQGDAMAATAPTQRKLAAILAADVAGYSRLMGADEGGTLEALKAIRAELTDPTIAAHYGRLGERGARRHGRAQSSGSKGLGRRRQSERA